MNAQEAYDSIKEKLKTIDPGLDKFIKDDGSKLAVDQVWTTKDNNPDVPTYLIVVTDVFSESVVTVRVMFRWTELAGPADVKLHPDMLGSRYAYSFELEATILAEHLGRCIGRLPQEVLDFVEEAKEELVLPSNERYMYWGRNYLDDADHLMEYHIAIVSDMERMQAGVLDSLEV